MRACLARFAHAVIGKKSVVSHLKSMQTLTNTPRSVSSLTKVSLCSAGELCDEGSTAILQIPTGPEASISEAKGLFTWRCWTPDSCGNVWRVTPPIV